MTDLDRLDEALDFWDGMGENFADAFPAPGHIPRLVEAARAYRDLLANGERVWVCREMPWWTPEDTKADYDAYMKRLMDPDDEAGGAGHYCSPFAAHYEGCGWRLLVDPPKEEER